MYKIFSFALLFGGLCFGQQNQNSDIEKPIRNLFAGMKNSDPEMMKSAFADTAILQTITKDGVKTEDIEAFVNSVSQMAKGDLEEKITIEAIHTDGNLASVFTPYSFYYKKKFSHCGVNSFQLIKIGKEWKIQYVIDTRRTDNCKEIK
ncbi:nuclear transport factor 2 family protein [uncultured Chryseobacterium sp.]|uniref:nuclear transport factor 2 family protein n=1 Tax=uncultured Chryseobacterium sp. TaxID=259322 RepID=UPI0037487570